MRLPAVLAVALVLAACGRDTPPAPRANECRAAERDVPELRNFTPPTEGRAGRTVMPLVFSDGTTAELTYPPELDLASLGVSVLRTSGVVEGAGPESGRAIDVRYGAPPAAMKKGGRPIACYEGAHGQAEVWETGDDVVPNRIYVPLDDWTAYLSDGNVGSFLSEHERRAWATALAVESHPDGWVTLRRSPELRVGVEHTGDVSLELGDVARRALTLWPVECRGPGPDDVEVQLGEVGGGQAFASWCDERGPMQVHVYADAGFIRDVAAGLEVSDVRHAHDPGRYHVVP